MTPGVIFHLREGRITNPKVVRKAFALKDGTYEIKITKKTKRSLRQKGYYFAVIVPSVQAGLIDLGHDVTLEETHEMLKAKFNFKEVVNHETGEFLVIPKSTEVLNKEEYGIYIDKIIIFAAEFLGVTIPLPNSQSSLNYFQ